MCKKDYKRPAFAIITFVVRHRIKVSWTIVDLFVLEFQVLNAYDFPLACFRYKLAEYFKSSTV